MARDTGILAVMWAAAAISIVTLSLARSPTRTTGTGQRSAVTRTPSSERAEAATVGMPRPTASSASAATFRADARHTARSPFSGPRAPTLAWAFEIGERVTAQPVVDDQGRVYVGAHDGYFYALSASGALLWKRYLGSGVPGDPKARARIYSTAHLDGAGGVFVGSDDDTLFELGDDGSLRSRLATSADADTAVTPAPDGTLWFGAGNRVFAFEPMRGLRASFEAWGKVYTSPAVDLQNVAYVGSQDDHLYALDREATLRWSFLTGGDVDSSPVVGDDGSIFAGSDDGHVYALSPEGQLRWRAAVDGYVRAPLALDFSGHVIAAVMGPRPRIVALDAASGEGAWSFALSFSDSADVGATSGPIVDARGTIYVGAHDDHLYALSAEGTLEWAFETAGDVDGPAVLTADGTLLFGCDDGHLYALRTRGEGVRLPVPRSLPATPTPL